MPLLLNDFACGTCGHTFESLEDSDTRSIPCEKCGSQADRLVPTPRFALRMGVDPVGNPTMGDKWARVHEQQLAQQRKEEREQARYGE